MMLLQAITIADQRYVIHHRYRGNATARENVALDEIDRAARSASMSTVTAVPASRQGTKNITGDSNVTICHAWPNALE
jgi:hypothetical protein